MLSLLICAGFTAPPAVLKAAVLKATTALTRQLGDTAFRNREAAERCILEFGGLARPAVIEACKSADAETRERARRLLPLLSLVDVNRQIQRFDADRGGTAEVRLPGWEAFNRCIGNDPAARKFFITLLRSQFDLLLPLESDPRLAGQLGAHRCAEIQQAMQARWQVRRGPNETVPDVKVDLPQFAALMLIGMDERVHKAGIQSTRSAVQDSSDQYPLSSLMGEPYFKEYLTTHESAPLFKKLFLAWLDVQADRMKENSGNQEMYYLFEAVKNTRLKEAVGFLERVLKGKFDSESSKAQAMVALGVVGDKKHIPLFEADLKNTAEVSNFQIGGNGGNKAYRAEVRDIALGMIIHLSGEKPNNFGFEGVNVWGNQGDGNFEYYQFSFTDDANRKATIKKWADFQAEKAKKSPEKK